MAERRAFVFRGVTPRQVLAALNRVASDLPLLTEIGFGLRLEASSVLGTYLAPVVPDYTRKIKNRDRQEVAGEAVNRLGAALAQVGGSADPAVEDVDEAAIMPWPSGVAWCLLNDSEEDATVAGTDEWLLLGFGLSDERAATLVEDVRFHATHFRIGTATDTARRSVLALHIKDDAARGASFKALREAGALEDTVILRAAIVDGRYLFIPEDVRPGIRALQDFLRIVLSDGPSFGLPDRAGEADMILAVREEPGPEGQPPTAVVYALETVEFEDEAVVAPTALGYATLALNPLDADRERLEALTEAIQMADPQVGYRLELRGGHKVDTTEAERVRLMEQIADLEYRLAYLNAVSDPRPVLLRYDGSQIAALADAIRSFPESDLRNERVLYGFQATEDNPGGWHFLYFDPRAAVMTEPYPVWRWEREGAPNMRFWLDPYWARYYANAGNQSYIFVPEGQALFPALHGWEPEDMDSYMRTMLRRWFRDDDAITRMPGRPVYVFDGEASPDAEIRVQVLDLAAMQPVGLVLGWLNDNLVIRNGLNIEKELKGAAADMAWSKIADDMKTEFVGRQTELRELARDVNLELASQVDGIKSIATKKVLRLEEESARTVAQMQELMKKMRGVRDQLIEVQKLADEIEAQDQQVIEDAAEWARERTRVINGLAASVQDAARLRKAVETNINGMVSRLRETRRKLLERIQGVNR